MSSRFATRPGPRTLKAEVGGYMGPSYTLELRGADLDYASSPHRREFNHRETVPVADEAWTRFASELDELEVWGWLESYEDQDVLDGTSWEVAIHWGDRQVKSSGFNAYPETWERFCDAIEQLLDGRSFR